MLVQIYKRRLRFLPFTCFVCAHVRSFHFVFLLFCHAQTEMNIICSADTQVLELFYKQIGNLSGINFPMHIHRISHTTTAGILALF